MVAIKQGKWTHDRSEGLVVFLVGMRVNKPSRVRTWWPTFAAMPKMLEELYTHPETGFLGATSSVHGRGALVVTYWRDMEALMAYAHASDAEHRPAWTAFNRSARESAGVVGIWHETFVVPAGGHESLYVDMPADGLPKATGPVAVTSRRDNARARMARAS